MCARRRRDSSVLHARFVLVGALFALLSLPLSAQTLWTAGGGTADWSDPFNWSTGIPPGSADDVVIQNLAPYPDLSFAASDEATRNLTIDPGATLTLGGQTLEIYGDFTNNGTFDATGAGSAVGIRGGIAQNIDTGGDPIRDLIINKAAGTATATAPITLNDDLTLTAGTLAMGVNALSVAGDVSRVGGSLTSSGTVTLDGTAAQAVDFDGSTLTNLTIDGTGPMNAGGTIDLSGDLTRTAGDLAMGGFALQVGGNIVSTGGALSSTGTVTLDGGGAQAVNFTGATLANLTINKGGGTATAGSVISLSGNLARTAGNLDMGGFALTVSGDVTWTAGSLTNTGLVTLDGGTPTADFGSATLGSLTIATTGAVDASGAAGGPIIVTGDLTRTSGGLNMGANALTVGGGIAYAGGALQSTGTITLNGGGAQAVDFTNSTLTNLTINKAGGTATAGSGIDLGGALNRIAGDLSMGGNALTIGGNVNWAAGSLTNTGLVTLDGGTPTVDFENATLGSLTVATAGVVNASGAAGGPISVTGALTRTSGGLNMGANTLTVGGDIVYVAGVLQSTGTVTLNGGGAQAVDFTSSTLADLTLNNVGGTATAGSAIVLSGTLSRVAGNLAMGPNGLTVAGNVTHFGGTLTSGGTITLNGGGAQVVDLLSSTLTNLTVNSVGPVTLGQGMDLSGDLARTAGNVDLSGFALTVAGNVTHGAGTLTNTGLVTLDGGAAQSVDFTGATLAALRLNNTGAAGITANGPIDVVGTLTRTDGDLAMGANALSVGGDIVYADGALTSTGTVTLDGGGAQAVDFTASTLTNLTINKGGGTVTAGSAIDVNADLTRTAGDLNMGGNALTIGDDVIYGAGTLTNTGLVTLDGGGAQGVDFTNATLDALTVAKGGGTATLTGAPTLTNDLTMTSGTLALGAGLSVGRDVLLNGGDFQPGGNTVSVTRDWSLGAGTFTRGTSTVDFTGGGTSSIAGSNRFHTLSSIAPGKTLEFPSGSTTRVDTLTVDGGAAATRITLQGSAAADWTLRLDDAAGSSVDFATITYGQIDDATVGGDVGVTNSQDAGNNDVLGPDPHWDFTGQALTWDAGAGTSDWTDPVNWSGDEYYPGAGDEAIIAAAGQIPDVPVGGPDWVVGTLTVTGTLDMNGLNLVVTDAFSNTGTVLHYAASALNLVGTAVMDTDSGEFEYAGAGGPIQDFGGTDYYNLTFNSGGQTFTLPGDLTLGAGGALDVQAGTLELGAGQVVTITAGDLAVSGTISAAGATSTMSVGGSVQFNGGSALTNPGNTEIIFTGGAGETFDPDVLVMPTVRMQKSGGSVSVSADVVQAAGESLTFANTGLATLTLNGNDWTLANTLNLGDANATLRTGAGTLIAGANPINVSDGLLRVENLGSLTSTSTIDVSVNGELQVDAGGGVTTTNALTQGGGTVTHDGSVSAGSVGLTGGSYDHNAGSLATTGGDLTVAGGDYDGTGAGTVGVTGALSVTSGTVDLGAKTVSTGGAAGLSVSGGIFDFGTATVNVGGTADADISGGTIELGAGQIVVNDGDFSLAAAATTIITGAGASIDTSTNDGDVTILDAIGGNGTLTIDAGNGVAPASTVRIDGVQTFGGLTVTAATLTRLAGSFTTAVADPGGLDVTSTAINLGDPAGFTANTSANDGLITFNGPVEVVNNSTVTALNGGPPTIRFTGAVDSATTADLTVDTTGGGSIAFDAAVGGTNPLGALDVTAGTAVDFAGVVRAVSVDVTAIGSLATFDGDVTTSGAGGITVSGNGVITNGARTLRANGTGSIDITVGASDLVPTGGQLTLTTTNDVTVTGNIDANTNEDILVSAGAADVEVSGTIDAGSFTQAASGTGTTTLRSDVTTTTGGVSIDTVDLTLDGLTIDTSAAAAGIDITASTTLASADVILDTGGGAVDFNGTVDGPRDLRITASGGAVTFAGAVGAGVDVGDGTGAAITIVSSGGIGTTFSSTVDTASGIVSNSAGLTTFDGDVTISGGGTTDSSFTGSVDFSSALDWVSDVALTIGNAAADTFTTSGATRINTSSGNADLTLNATTTIDGDLIVTAGGGNVDVLANLTRSLAADDLTVTSSNTTTVGPAAQIGTAVARLGTVLINGGGAFAVGSDIYAGTITVTNDAVTVTDAGVQLNATAGIAVSGGPSTIDGDGGADDITLTAGTSVTVDGAIGGATSVDALTVTAGGAVTVDDIGTALAEGVSGATDIQAGTGITLTGTNYRANQQTYDAGDPFLNTILVNSGAATTFRSSGDLIEFVGRVALVALDLNVTSFGGDILARDIRSIAGADIDVTLNAAGGDITVYQIGSGTEINTVELTAATSNLYGSITTDNAAGNSVTVSADAVIGAVGGVTIDTTGAAGGISIGGDVAGLAGGEDLTIQASSAATAPNGGDVTVGGSLGLAAAGDRLGAVVVQGRDIVLNGIQTAVGGGNTVTVTARDSNTAGAVLGSIRLNGTTYDSGDNQTYRVFDDTNPGNPADSETPPTAEWIGLIDGVNKSFAAGAGTISFHDVYIDLGTDAFTLTLGSDVFANRFIHVGGTIDFGGNSLTLTDDFVSQGNGPLVGSGYGANDPDTDPDVNEWIYPEQADFTPLFAPSNTAQYADLAGTTITVGEDFYVNGTDMDGTAGWNLDLPAPGPVPDITAAATDPAKWGTPYAVAFNMNVSNSVADEWVAAAAANTFSVDGVNYARMNNDVTFGAGNVNWDFDVPEIVDARTIWDHVIRIEFSEPIRNAGNVARDAITTPVAAGTIGLNDEPGQVWVHDLGATGGTVGVALDNVWADATPANPAAWTALGAGAPNVIYVGTAAAGTWNTDADGGHGGVLTRGVGAGDPLSTNVQGVQQTIDVALHFIKGLFVDNESRNAVPGYGGDADIPGADWPAGFENTQDFTAPALVGVEIGRFDHDETVTEPTVAYESFDGKNYFQLRYSEAVDIGGAAGPAFLDSAAADGLTGSDADLTARRAETAFGGGQKGGYIDDGGGSGIVTVLGYFSYPGTFLGGSTDPIASTALLYRRPTAGVVPVTSNAYGNHGLRIAVAAHSQENPGVAQEWTGFIEQASDPAGATVTLAGANLIDVRDITPNANQLLDSSGPPYAGFEPVIVDDASVAPVLQGWDVDPPDVAMFRPNGVDSDYEEIVTIENGGSAAFLDRVELHIHDNPSARAGWVSAGVGVDHPDVVPDPGAQGIRDYQVREVLANSLATPGNNFLFFDFQGQTSPREFPAGTSFDTGANNGFFTQTDVDDSYFSFQMLPDANNFPVQATMWIGYAPTLTQTGAANVITDIAGNAMQPFTGYTSIERIPPQIAVTLAIADTNLIYLRFNEYVKGAGGAPLDPTDFAVEDGTGAPSGISVTNVQPLLTDPTDPVATLDMLLTLDANLTREHVLRFRVGPSAAGSIEDRFAAQIEADEDNRVTDIAMGVIAPTAAWNEIQREDLYGDEFAGLLDASEFEGNGVLLDRTTTLQATILPVPSNPGVNDGLPVLMYYDVEPPEEYLTPEGYWVIEESGIIDDPETQEAESVPRNDQARTLSPISVSGPVREFIIPDTDEEFQAGGEVEFMFSVAGIPAARATDPGDPRSVDQWSFNVTPFVTQRSGVTILNNVIYPENGDKTVLSLQIEQSGMFTVQVFTLDGQVVNVLQRGRLASGEHFLTWDGTNAGGRIVASGLYFVRVVGPGVDEIRKVLVAK